MTYAKDHVTEPLYEDIMKEINGGHIQLSIAPEDLNHDFYKSFVKKKTAPTARKFRRELLADIEKFSIHARV